MKRVVYFVVLVLLTCGFRIFPKGNTWDVSIVSPKLFVRWCQTYTVPTNDLSSEDPLFGTTPAFTDVTNSIMNDYNNVAGSFVTLVDANTDPDFNTIMEATRTISICVNDLPTAGGEARPKYEEGRVVGCEISLDPKTLDKLSSFVRTVTHEIGHCLGLDHPQETTNAVMSYYSSKDFLRLQIDDKMGIVYLYPVYAKNAKETPTFGLSCAPAD